MCVWGWGVAGFVLLCSVSSLRGFLHPISQSPGSWHQGWETFSCSLRSTFCIRSEQETISIEHFSILNEYCKRRDQDLKFRRLEKEWRRVDNKRRRVEEKTQQTALLARLSALMGGFQVAMFINQGVPSIFDTWPLDSISTANATLANATLVFLPMIAHFEHSFPYKRSSCL